MNKNWSNFLITNSIQHSIYNRVVVNNNLPECKNRFHPIKYPYVKHETHLNYPGSVYLSDTTLIRKSLFINNNLFYRIHNYMTRMKIQLNKILDIIKKILFNSIWVFITLYKYFYMRLTICYILKPLSIMILFYMTYYCFLFIFNYLFITESLPSIITKETLIVDFQPQISKIQNIIPSYNKGHFQEFYNKLHPDYYETHIRPFLIETTEEKLIRIAYEKYHHAHLNHKLYLISQENRAILMTHLVYSTIIFGLSAEYSTTLNFSIIGLLYVVDNLLLLTMKFWFMDDELLLHLSKSKYTEEFLYNKYPPNLP